MLARALQCLSDLGVFGGEGPRDRGVRLVGNAVLLPPPGPRPCYRCGATMRPPKHAHRSPTSCLRPSPSRTRPASASSPTSPPSTPSMPSAFLGPGSVASMGARAVHARRRAERMQTTHTPIPPRTSTQLPSGELRQTEQGPGRHHGVPVRPQALARALSGVWPGLARLGMGTPCVARRCPESLGACGATWRSRVRPSPPARPADDPGPPSPSPACCRGLILYHEDSWQNGIIDMRKIEAWGCRRAGQRPRAQSGPRRRRRRAPWPENHRPAASPRGGAPIKKGPCSACGVREGRARHGCSRGGGLPRAASGQITVWRRHLLPAGQTWLRSSTPTKGLAREPR